MGTDHEGPTMTNRELFPVEVRLLLLMLAGMLLWALARTT